MSMILRVEELGFKYNDIDILKDINFAIDAGDFIGILGPNGCGKTTLLNNINRWLKPNKGSIYVDNVDTIGLKPKDLAQLIATVPQDIPTQGGFTAEQIVMMGRNPYLKSFETEKAEDLYIVTEAMMAMDVLHLKEKPIQQLSGGERQRVSKARALAQQPRLLLLDEPTSHLDINYQWELLELLKRLCSTNQLTIVAVLHDINLASVFCNKIILLKDRKIYKMGSLMDVINERNIKEVFNIDAQVSLHRETQKPTIVFLNQREQRDLPRPYKKLHVISGGGEGEALLNYLSQRGYNITVGVINRSDTDWKTAKMLGLRIVEEKPFSAISDKSMKENIDELKKAEVIILANIPFGHGNLKNLTCLQEIAHHQKLIVIEEDSIEARDYTGGKATDIFNKYKRNAIVFHSLEELKSYL